MSLELYTSITDAVGRTPAVRLSKMAAGLPAAVLAKLEFFNPCSSVKDRVAAALVQDGEERGVIKEGSVLIEPTSGNTGIGLAFVCARKGYKLKLTMPESMSIERRKLLAALGAEIILTPAAQGMAGAVNKAKELSAAHGYYMPAQFDNPANPAVHMRTTGPELWQQTGGNIDFFVAGVGTGGTISGVGAYLKSVNPDVKIVAVEPASSPVLSGGTAGPHKIQGIGAGFVPGVFKRSVVDDIMTVSDDEAGNAARLLATNEGILAGISSGAAVYASLKIAARRENAGKTVVTLLPDTGERYLSTWLYGEKA